MIDRRFFSIEPNRHCFQVATQKAYIDIIDRLVHVFAMHRFRLIRTRLRPKNTSLNGGMKVRLLGSIEWEYLVRIYPGPKVVITSAFEPLAEGQVSYIQLSLDCHSKRHNSDLPVQVSLSWTSSHREIF